MNDLELITHLKSLNKPYQGIMPQGSFSSTIIRFEVGLLKPKTLAKFFDTMGYVNNNGKWEKKS
jgi:hypothetical protein